MYNSCVFAIACLFRDCILNFPFRFYPNNVLRIPIKARDTSFRLNLPYKLYKSHMSIALYFQSIFKRTLPDQTDFGIRFSTKNSRSGEQKMISLRSKGSRHLVLRSRKLLFGGKKKFCSKIRIITRTRSGA